MGILSTKVSMPFLGEPYNMNAIRKLWVAIIPTIILTTLPLGVKADLGICYSTLR